MKYKVTIRVEVGAMNDESDFDHLILTKGTVLVTKALEAVEAYRCTRIMRLPLGEPHYIEYTGEAYIPNLDEPKEVP